MVIVCHWAFANAKTTQPCSYLIRVNSFEKLAITLITHDPEKAPALLNSVQFI
jgi:hypothetical protein